MCPKGVDNFRITQGVIVSLSLPSSDVQTVTTAAAAGNVSLALVPPGS
jgi:hypothetical protein